MSDAAIRGRHQLRDRGLHRRAASSRRTPGQHGQPYRRPESRTTSRTSRCLKGAAASAIYGSKASNGVILITTKRGRVGAPQFSVTQRFGGSDPRNQFGARRVRQRGRGCGGHRGPAPWRLHAAAGRFLRRRALLFGKTPVSYETSASISGGTETTRYFASGLVKHDGGIVQNTVCDKQSLRLNIDQDVGAGRLTISLSTKSFTRRPIAGLPTTRTTGTSWQAPCRTPRASSIFRGICPDGPGTNPADPVLPTVRSALSAQPLRAATRSRPVALLTNRETVWRAICRPSRLTGRHQHAAASLSVHGQRRLATSSLRRTRVFADPICSSSTTDGFLGTLGPIDSPEPELQCEREHGLHLQDRQWDHRRPPRPGCSMSRNLNIDRDITLENLVGGLATQPGNGTFFRFTRPGAGVQRTSGSSPRKSSCPPRAPAANRGRAGRQQHQ